MALVHLFASTSVLWLGLRLLFSLAIVLGLIMALTWAARRGKGLGLGIGGGHKGAMISVRAREQVGRNTTVALLEVGDRILLIGANEQSIGVLAEGDDLLAEEPEAGSPSGGTALSTDDRTSSQSDPFIRGTSAPPGMNLIEALREWSLRRA